MSSVIKKNFNGSAVVQKITDMHPSSKSEKLLKSLFLLNRNDAARILKSFSFTATTDVTMVLLVAGILACAQQTKRPTDGFQDVFKFMGRGDGQSAATKLKEDDYKPVIEGILNDKKDIDKKLNTIVKNIRKRISKISKWKRSAEKVENYVLPIFEQVLTGTTYTKFYVAFKNAKASQKEGSAPKLDYDEKLSETLKTIADKLGKSFAKEVDTLAILVDVRLNTRLPRSQMDPPLKPDTNNKQNIIPYCHSTRTKDGHFACTFYLPKRDVIKALRDSDGDEDKCVALVTERTRPSLLKLKEKPSII